MHIGPETRVADLATQHPATIRVFQRHGIDFCCGGKRPLGAVCGEQALRLADLTRDLEEAVSAAHEPGPDWEHMPLADLVGQIVDHYHRPLDEELPRLDQMMQKVLRVHGQRHAELELVAETFGAIVADLGPHMMKEERVLFPFIARLEAGGAPGEPPVSSPFGSIQSPIGAMESEHEVVGEALVRLRGLTAGFEAPADACNTFRGLYHGFSELERELHEHIHVENNILFPRALRLEGELLAAARGRG
jgi:regulator of cell morphogenesis and NO signaling